MKTKFDRSSITTRTQTTAVVDVRIAEQFSATLERATELAESASLYTYLLSETDAANGIRLFEHLAKIAREGISRCKETKQGAEPAVQTELVSIRRAAQQLDISEEEVFVLLEVGKLIAGFEGAEMRIEASSILLHQLGGLEPDLTQLSEVSEVYDEEDIHWALNDLTEDSRVDFEAMVQVLFEPPTSEADVQTSDISVEYLLEVVVEDQS